MSDVDSRLMANAIRFLAMDAIERAGDGHPGAPLGCAEITTALFTRHLRFNPADPQWFDRDRFVLSNGHGSMLLYALLHLSGYERISIDEIRNFRTLGAHCAGHPEHDPQAGIEVTTGPLGQGIANAAGMAVAETFLRTWLGADLVDHRTYALVGDGCLQEGIGQEVISLAGHLRLGRLTFLWDDNQITDDGSLDIAQRDDMGARFRLSGWHVQEVDGHDVEAVAAALLLARQDPRPSMIACRTIIGRGIPRVQGQRGAHGGRVFAADTAAARDYLGWEHGPFIIPPDIRAAWRAGGARNAPDYDSWQTRLAALPTERRQLLDRLRAGRLPEGWERPLRAWREEAAASGLRQGGINSSADIVERLAEAIPELISGAPDLEGPTQHKRRLSAFGAGDPGGRYVHYGVREHAMGAMLNGMAAHGGVVPLGVTYLVFSDYERPAMRLAAMMGVPSLFVFSHDSIGIGRNGPTHQPVEFLASLRAMPNMHVFRPADAVEAAECWEAALANRGGPSALIFSRQLLPPVRREAGGPNRSALGAYVLAEAEGGPHRVTLLATGSEVAIALAARTILQAEGVPTSVVSMPCWEAFEKQDAATRAAVIPRGTVRVAVEAAIRQGWDRWIGEDGGFVGMSGFGASGPEAELFAHFGITAEAVAETARRRLAPNG
ncbi:MAG: transketolase [Rhodospirillales bacterium]|nr:transketolase [Rhodospirillales bacterium]MDE2199984.1 transketolase [Rhodospirillales bacterium]